jgi:polyhydroxyalkanoate synthase subunit PhaE
MSSDPWEEMTRRWREVYQEHAALAQKNWQDGQTQLATALAGGAMSDRPASTTALAELWRSWTTFGGSLWGSPPGVTGEARPGAGALGALPESVSLSLASGGAVSDALRRMGEGPRLADVGASERLMTRVMELWLSVQKSARHYESVVAGAWAQANTRFAERLAQRYGTGTDIPDAKESLKLWLDTANQVLLETHRSEKFLDAQRQLLRDGMDFMLAEREFVEALVEPAGLPTRTEIDEVHRSVHELKRRVKALERASAATSLDQPSVPATAATDRRRRATSKGQEQ